MNITLIGGGTGTTAVIGGLRDYPDLSLSVIVTMMDDGGSNEVVRDEFGLLPLSDLRKSIIALAKKPQTALLRELFLYRFSKGMGLNGHTLGNLIMIALSDITGSEKEAVNATLEIFDIKSKVIPVTLEHTRLIAKYANGKTVVGEHNIDTQAEDSTISELSMSNNVKANKDAIEAILKARFIVIGPGDLYTSVIPNIIVPGIPEALRKSRAKTIFVTNLMSKKGETRGMTIGDMAAEVEKYMGKKLDYVLINNGKIPEYLLERYEAEGEHPFKDDLNAIRKSERHAKIVRGDLISTKKIKKQKGDILKRSLIRHDPDKLGRELYYIFRQNTIDLLRFLSAR